MRSLHFHDKVCVKCAKAARLGINIELRCKDAEANTSLGVKGIRNG
jgi:hypothetical protein